MQVLPCQRTEGGHDGWQGPLSSSTVGDSDAMSGYSAEGHLRQQTALVSFWTACADSTHSSSQHLLLIELGELQCCQGVT